MKDYIQSVTTVLASLTHDTEYSVKAHCYFLIRVLLYPLHEMRSFHTVLPFVHRPRYHVVNFRHSSAFKA
jgi:hypothetical protein